MAIAPGDGKSIQTFSFRLLPGARRMKSFNPGGTADLPLPHTTQWPKCGATPRQNRPWVSYLAEERERREDAAGRFLRAAASSL